MIDSIGLVGTALVIVGGTALQRGRARSTCSSARIPSPTVFGYHEIFHLLVILAAAVQYAVVAFWVLPGV